VKHDSRKLLEEGLRRIKVCNPAEVAAKLIEFGTLLLAENQKTNLTGAKDIESLVTEHFLDSLAPLEFVELLSPVVDVGSGAGFPGIPAAIAFPRSAIVLLEPRAKRAAFLESVASRMELANISVIKASALGPKAIPFHGKAGTVLMRAVAEPEKAIGLGSVFVRPGGDLVLYEGRVARPTPEQRKAAARMDGEIDIRRVFVPGLSSVRHAWIIHRPTEPAPHKTSRRRRLSKGR
jgi:16S rRNA (guanine527-N7)-methyltransferase